MKNFILVALAIIVIVIFLQHHLVASLSPIQQKVALFQFKQSFNITTPTNCTYYDSYSESYEIPSNPKTMNWSMSSDHCTWEGVSCQHNTGDVIGLDLSCSGLEGAIHPNSTLFQLSHLRFLNLSNNFFYNEFPQEFGVFAKGPLPAMYIQNFKAMMIGDVNERKATYMEHNYLDSTFYSDSTFLVIKGVGIEFVRILTVLTTIDVSRNNFEGEIVEYIGDLVLLRYLNLSHNHLTGYIPSSIGNLSMLESLDLSSNQLQGEIPHQLTSIYSLAILNLSCNQLRGHIPEGSQFNTFENDSYVGNLGLCGHPLSKKCEINVGTQEEDDGDDDYFFSGFTWEAVVIGYGCGVVPAFVAGYLMLLAGKPKWFAGIIARELGLKIRRMEIKWR